MVLDLGRGDPTTYISVYKGFFDVNKDYMELTQLIERLHRRYLDVLRTQLKRAGIRDINGVQALILANIGVEEIAIRDLVERGYYQGSNVSYNIKKLTEMGYLEQERSEHDKRSVTVKLTDKAKSVVESMRNVEDANAQLFDQRQGERVPIKDVCGTLRALERTWADYIHYGDGD